MLLVVCEYYLLYFFFFKQKTAYELRISDWSSDVCSSDLLADGGLIAFLLPAMGFLHNHAQNTVEARDAFFRKSQVRRIINFADLRFQLFEKAQDRKSVV